jgi:hypothetical protein
MMEMRPRELLGALVDEDVDFVLIGGLAAALHGTTRVTRDIDIAYSTTSANLVRLSRALNRFAPRRLVLGRPQGGVIEITPALLKRERTLQLATSVGEVDLLSSIEGFKSYGFVKRKAEVRDVGIPVPVLSIEGLVRTKKAMNRPKDQQDIVELQALDEAQRLSAPEDGASFRLG